MLTKSKIHFIKSLSKKSERDSFGCFVVEGGKMAQEVVGAGMSLREVYVSEISAEIVDLFKGVADITRITPMEMDRISLLKTPTRVLIIVDKPNYEIDYDSLISKLTLVLDMVQDPGNLGTIIRLCDWFGIENVVCAQGSADLYSPKVVQATMGAITRVKVHYTELVPFVKRLKDSSVPIYGTFLDGDDIYSQRLSPSGVIVMGNEGSGISSLLEKEVTSRLTISSYPSNKLHCESLNVATATAIVCSEFRRKNV